MPAEVDWLMEERGYKRHTVGAGSTSGLEIILTLLVCLIAIYVEFFIVQVGKTNFKKTFLRPLMGSATSLSIHEDFHKLVEVYIGKFGRCRHGNRRERKNRRRQRNKRKHGNTRGNGSGNTRVCGRRSRQWKTAAISRWKCLSTFSKLVSTGSKRIPAKTMTEARVGHLHKWLDNR